MSEMKDYYESISPVAESFRALRTKIKRSFLENGWKTLLITAAGPGEGATSISLDLARSFQKNGDKVLLVDANLRLPALGEQLDARGEGLSDILARGAMPTERIVTPTEEPDLLPAGKAPENPAEMLGSKNMQQLLEALKEQYEIILIDTPPAAVVADAAILSAQTDAVLLVVEDGAANKRQVKKAIDAIEQAGGHLIGAVMNKTSPRDMR